MASGVATKNSKNGMYGPGMIAHSNAIINQNNIHTQIPDAE